VKFLQTKADYAEIIE